MKERLDVLLVKRGFSRIKRKGKGNYNELELFLSIMKEKIKPVHFLKIQVNIEVQCKTLKYVSRGRT